MCYWLQVCLLWFTRLTFIHHEPRRAPKDGFLTSNNPGRTLTHIPGAFTFSVPVTAPDPLTPFCKTFHLNISSRRKSPGRSHKSVQRQDHPLHTYPHPHIWSLNSSRDGWNPANLLIISKERFISPKGEGTLCCCTHAANENKATSQQREELWLFMSLLFSLLRVTRAILIMRPRSDYAEQLFTFALKRPSEISDLWSAHTFI